MRTRNRGDDKNKELKNLHDQWVDKPVHIVLKNLEHVLQQETSFIDSHSDVRLWRKTKTRKTLEKNMHDGVRFLRSPHAITTSIREVKEINRSYLNPV